MRRLFSSFAGGLPGVGLLVLRLAAAAAVSIPKLDLLTDDVLDWQTPALVLSTCLSVLLIAGLWTPVVGTLTALLEVGLAVWHGGDVRTQGLVASLGMALAFLGPGAWSADAWLFGCRRIEIPQRRGRPDRP